MLSLVRRVVALTALAVASASVAQAQIRVEEVRVDMATLAMIDGSTVMNLGNGGNLLMPAGVTLGIYLNDKIAIEPTVGFFYFKPDGGDAVTQMSLGVFAPYYFAADRGHNGLFIAPGLMITKQTDIDAMIDFGADFGYKKAMNDKVSWAAAATFRTGDTYDPDSVIGGRFGFSIFWR